MEKHQNDPAVDNGVVGRGMADIEHDLWIQLQQMLMITHWNGYLYRDYRISVPYHLCCGHTKAVIISDSELH